MMRKQRQPTYKTAKVIKEYRVKMYGYEFIVPVGATVSNLTACGNDDNYRFWVSWESDDKEIPSIVKHDLIYRGLNVPAEYCESYENIKGIL